MMDGCTRLVQTIKSFQNDKKKIQRQIQAKDCIFFTQTYQYIKASENTAQYQS
jgi:hypothetical protein